MADHKISVLSGIEAIQQRPGMYIGSTSNPNHLAQEVLDNAIDELMEGHANKISLTIDNDDYSVTVTDNGRGIPIHHVKLQHGQIKDSIEAACTELHSGSKFKKSSYRFSGGMHGIGLVAVNALSTELSIGVVKDNKLYVYLFNNGQLVNKQTTTPTNDIDWSTLVYFKVNPEYFTSPKFTLEHFNRRLYLIKAKFPNSEIIFNNKKIPDISLRQYVSYALGYQHELEPKYLPHLQIEDVTYKVDLFFTYNKHVTGKVTGDVNSIICSGTYQTNFETIFYNTVCEVFGEKYPRNVIINGLQAYLSLMLSHTAFSSQTKTHMTKNVSHILNNLKSELAKIIKHNPFIRDNIQEAIDDYTRRRAAKNVKVSKKRVSVENPLKDCLQIPGKTLFIVEGESAGGTVSDVRDVKTEAILPLSGKILNVSNASIDQAVSSKKFKYLLECLGVDLTKKNQSDLRYEQVKIRTDADSVSAETRITFLDKQGFLRQKEIQHIKSDEIDKVVSYNKKTHKMELKRVLRVIKHKYTKNFIYRIHLYDNHFVDCTQDHVLYIYDQIQGKVVEIGPEEINIKSHLFVRCYIPENNIPNTINKVQLSEYCGAIEIKHIEKIPYNHEFVYDLEVEDNNNFCCNEIGVVLHNSDGSHITVLLLLALWKFAPNLIRERRVHVLTPPLYGTYVNKKFVPIFRTSDLKNYKGQITRFKGLGEMNPDQLEVIIRNPKYMYTVNPPADEKEEMNILECISNVELKRALCNIDTLNLERFLETVLNNSET